MTGEDKDTMITNEELYEILKRLERDTNERFEKIELNELTHLSLRVDSIQQNFGNMLLDYQKEIYARILELEKGFNTRLDKIFYCAIGTLTSVIIAIAVVILKMWGAL